MQHRTVSDLMTRDVVVARRATPFKEVVRTLADHDVTAVPVVDADSRPVGVVSEADLLRKASNEPGLTGLVPLPALEDWERAKAEGARAEELMTAPPVCVRPEWTVVEAAQLMEAHGVKRLPVVDGADRLVGVVSRGDLLRVFLRRDDAIRDEIHREVLRDTLGLAPSEVTADVRGGRVELLGRVEARSLIPVLVRLCRSVDGVVSVQENLTFRTDDTGAMSRRSPLGR
ncbi:hypothetical protein N566_00310 [Streptomycetaceae bacterium MP113-05]|nr:hypothetical protein N566_00310 [Streptomycetaceae bacterium MP113-05]